MMHGKGTFEWNNGQKYEGNYLEDLKHGPGILTMSDGIILKANWVKGKLDGKGIAYTPDGKEKHFVWKMGAEL